MAGAQDEADVKDIERVEITPADDDDETIDPETTDPSSEDETGDDPEEGKKPDALQQRITPPAKTEGNDGLADVEGETPRERALRLELTNLRTKLRSQRGQELFTESPAPAPAAKELAPEKAAVISKYNQDEINALREIVPILAEEMGFVNKNELQGTTFQEKSQEVLDSFLENHKEYLPENDKDGTLWEAFTAEFKLYKEPSNPKDFKRIFEKVHKDVFGIKPAGALQTTTNAQRAKQNVASHAGASSTPSSPRAAAAAAPTGMRFDMLKGFTDEERAEMFGDE